MTSRIPPSRRDPEFAPQRAAKVVQAQTPGAGRVAQASPVLSGEVAALLRGRAGGASGGGDSDHVGDAPDSTAVGAGAVSLADDSTAVGKDAGVDTGGDFGVAVGRSAAVYGAQAVAVGAESQASGENATALGYQASAGGARAIAIGKGATSSTPDRALIKANDLEVQRSNGTGSTGLRLYNEASSPYVLGLHVGTSAPTNGCVFWYDTDDTC